MGVADGDGEGGAGGADGGGAHAEFAGGDAVDGGEEAFAAVAEGAVEGVVVGEAAVVGLEEGGAGEGRWSKEVRQWSTGRRGGGEAVDADVGRVLWVSVRG
ncbi:hypothetical protein [Streptomyces tendae]|uniref:Uncharacterized protein n=1 Tax=Streptomyces tendae TaxID=1932 RepID=A0ABX5ZSX5_STRTE|nr:hypothetical protein [Streptomyces tendae]QER87671.1 hypothetical protein F3L20_19000 [Streptomyces tendae]